MCTYSAPQYIGLSSICPHHKNDRAPYTLLFSICYYFGTYYKKQPCPTLITSRAFTLVIKVTLFIE